MSRGRQGYNDGARLKVTAARAQHFPELSTSPQWFASELHFNTTTLITTSLYRSLTWLSRPLAAQLCARPLGLSSPLPLPLLALSVQLPPPPSHTVATCPRARELSHPDNSHLNKAESSNHIPPTSPVPPAPPCQPTPSCDSFPNKLPGLSSAWESSTRFWSQDSHFCGLS